MGPQGSPSEFNLPVGDRRRVSIPPGTGASSSRRRWAHFPRDTRQDRFARWPEAAGGKVAASFGSRCLGPRGGLHPRTEERPPWLGPPALPTEATCVDCSQCSQTAGRRAVGDLPSRTPRVSG